MTLGIFAFHKITYRNIFMRLNESYGAVNDDDIGKSGRKTANEERRWLLLKSKR